MCVACVPCQNNGMKFFTAEGGLAKPDITQILAAAAEKAAAAGAELGDDMQVCAAQQPHGSNRGVPGSWHGLDSSFFFIGVLLYKATHLCHKGPCLGQYSTVTGGNVLSLLLHQAQSFTCVPSLSPSVQFPCNQ